MYTSSPYVQRIGLGQVRRTLESEVASLKHRASETDRVAPEDSLSPS